MQSQEQAKVLGQQLESQRTHFVRMRDEALLAARMQHKHGIDGLRAQGGRSSGEALEQHTAQHRGESRITLRIRSSRRSSESERRRHSWRK